MNLKITTQITPEILTSAEQELFEILYQQRLKFNQRWYTSKLLTKFLSIVRVIAPLLALLGIAICVFAIINKKNWGLAGVQWYLLVFFLLAGLFFYKIPSFHNFMHKKADKMAIGSCKRQAKRAFKKANKLAPFQSEYDIKNNLLTYYRSKNEKWTLAWVRRLNGIAIHNDRITVFFRKPTSIQARIVLIHNNKPEFQTALSELGIESIAYRDMR